MGSGHSTPYPTTIAAVCVPDGGNQSYNYTPNVSIPDQITRECDGTCSPEQILDLFDARITCPAGYSRADPSPSASNFVTIPVVPLVFCRDTTGRIFASSGPVCGPQTKELFSGAPSTPFTHPTFGEMVVISQGGIELYNDAGEAAGTATLMYDDNGEPIFNINITDPSIDEIIDVETTDITTWAMNSKGLLLTLKSGRKIVTINITYDFMRLSFVIEVKEPVAHEGVCGYQTTAKVYLLSDTIELTPSNDTN